MRATYIYGAGDIRVEDAPDPKLLFPTDAIVRVTRACICGSDLHPYHSKAASEHGTTIGHEFIGVIEELGADVATLNVGDFVIGCHESLGAYFLPTFLRGFLEAAPGIEVMLWNGTSAAVTEAMVTVGSVPGWSAEGGVSAGPAGVVNWARASSALPRPSHTRPHVSSAKGKEGPVRVARANQKSARAGWPSRSAICARAERAPA